MTVFPLHNIERDRECSCGKRQCSSAGKHPRLTDWQGLATRDEGQIAAWWKQWPDANVGVKCGRDSGVTVLDVDGEMGRETLRDLEMENGELPETPIAITGSGGAHYYFKFEPETGNAVRFTPGLDVRTEGGLVVGVGSVTKRAYWSTGFVLGST
jgi:putative DNA primase/helicase